MRNLFKKFSKSTTPLPKYSLMRPESRTNASSWFHKGGVRAGHIPVYVGEEEERFVVKAELLKHPVFVKLLDKSAQEYGYDQKGVLRIPCNVFLFERVLETLCCSQDERDLWPLVDMLSDELYQPDEAMMC